MHLGDLIANTQVTFTDFQLSFGAAAGVRGNVRKRTSDEEQEFEISGAKLTLCCSVKSSELFAECAGENWRCWSFGEIQKNGKAKQSAKSTLERIANDLDNNTFQAEDLNGHFLLLGHHLPTRAWHIWTDRFGTLHAYHSNDGTRSAIGTFFQGVAAAASRCQLDWQGLTGFFGFGFFPEDRTYFDDVRILRPASHYVFGQDGKLSQHERYWHWWHRPDQQRSYEDTVAEFSRLLKEVLASETQSGRVAIPISGGLDSRSTVAVIDSLNGNSPPGRELWSYSYGYVPGSMETSIGRRVAAARGLPFQSFTIRQYLFENLDRIISCVEGFQDVTQCRQAAVVDDIGAHADYLIAAHWGDVWLDETGLAHEKKTLEDGILLSHVLHKIEKPGRDWLLEKLCKPRLNGHDPNSLLREMTKNEMADLTNIEDPDFKVKAFKTDQWSFRWTTVSLRMFQAAAFPRLPFYDSRLTDFFCTVPSEFMCGRALQIDFLKRFAPDLARITWQVYDTNLFRYQHSNSWLLPKRALKKGWRILTNQQLVQRNWEAQFLNENGKKGLGHWLLRKGLRLHELVDPQSIRQLFDSFYLNRDKQDAYAISMLLTFSAWLENSVADFGGAS